jgi:hypothetical protein
MSPKKKKPALLVIEGSELAENIVLALKDSELNNKSLQDAIASNNEQLEKLKKLISKL